jgi:hypothetical protein
MPMEDIFGEKYVDSKGIARHFCHGNTMCGKIL